MTLFLAALFFSSSLSQASQHDLDELKQRLSGPRVGAHQGGIFGGGPNTLEQFETAAREGMDVIEMDLRISQDGIPIVFHDEDLDSLTNCRGRLRELPAAEITQCAVNGNGNLIPTFESVLEWANGRVVINAEFKDPETIAPALELMRDHDAGAWTYFQTQGDPGKYWLARELDPTAALLFAVRSKPDLDWALSLNDPALLVIEVVEDTRRPEYLSQIKMAGKFVSEDVWNFRRDRELFGAACEEGFKAGLDIVISNRLTECVRQRDRFHGRLVY